MNNMYLYVKIIVLYHIIDINHAKYAFQKKVMQYNQGR